jgi:hypothetical protein
VFWDLLIRFCRFSLVLSRIPVEIYCFKFVVLVFVGEGGTLCCCTEASGLSCYRSRIDSLVCRWGNERNLCWMYLDRGRFLLLLLRLLLHGITMNNLVRFFEPSKCSDTSYPYVLCPGQRRSYSSPPCTLSFLVYVFCEIFGGGYRRSSMYVCMYVSPCKICLCCMESFVSVLAVELGNFICERFMFFCFRHLW